VNAADTAWVLVSAALVMFMTPGLALFYGGMLRAKSVLNTMALTVACLGVISVIWVAFGFSLGFGPDAGHEGLIGDLSESGLRNLATVTANTEGHHIPTFALASFQLMFAVITVALLAGAVAERTRFWPFLVFAVLWVTIVYIPLAHWIFDPSGWFAKDLHVDDFAGGTAVETNSGAAALALAAVVRKRLGWPREQARPHNLPATLLGAGILWFGWFGFNAGSALAADGLAATAFLNTMLAGGTGMLGWLIVEQRRDGKPTTLGAASGAVAGLVGITPACGFVEPLGGAAVGFAAGIICGLAIRLKFRIHVDDSLDVVAVHGVGGVIGLLATGLLATASVNAAGGNGLFYGGGLTLLGHQAVAVVVTIAYSAVLTFGIAWAVQKTVGLRASEDDELLGLDEAEHAETAYDHGRLSPHLTGGRSGPVGRESTALHSRSARHESPGHTASLKDVTAAAASPRRPLPGLLRLPREHLPVSGSRGRGPRAARGGGPGRRGGRGQRGHGRLAHRRPDGLRRARRARPRRLQRRGAPRTPVRAVLAGRPRPRACHGPQQPQKPKIPRPNGSPWL
jgi:ammonium transporter